MSEVASRLLDQAETRAVSAFSCIEKIERINTARVLRAFQELQISSRHFAATTGYGYGDEGREALDRLFALSFGCEDALVRPSIASGTHALSACLFALLRPGDVLLAGTGAPYDTLHGVIAGEKGSLADWGVGYREVPLVDGLADLPGILQAVSEEKRAKVVLLQRSCGYAWRPSISVARLGEIARAIKDVRPDVFVMVDNCYGEFVEESEPVAAGADVMAGSLIKNPGGGLAPTGGYIAGTRECVERASAQLVAPGIGREVGSYAFGYDRFFQGLFLAPHTVAQALKCAVLAASAMELLGYETQPRFGDRRSDIIQAVRLGDPAKLIALCEGIQAASPVDSHVRPEPWDMPGYDDPVIMAAGAFVGGASIELTADAPLREPYIAYLQGGLTYAHGRIALEEAMGRIV